MNKEKLNELIDKYALDNVSESELNQIQKEMEINPQLKDDLSIRRDLVKSMEINSNRELKTLLDKIHDEEISKSKLWNKYLLGFLFFTLLGALGLLISKKSKDVVKPDVLYASYYKPYQASFQNRSEVNNSDLAKFQELYMEGEYRSAIDAIIPVPPDAPDDIKLAAGISALETNNVDLAEGLFKEIIANQSIYFSDHAKWYLSLIYMKSGDLSKTKNLLSELISDPKSDHYTDAINLLSLLE